MKTRCVVLCLGVLLYFSGIHLPVSIHRFIFCSMLFHYTYCFQSTCTIQGREWFWWYFHPLSNFATCAPAYAYAMTILMSFAFAEMMSKHKHQLHLRYLPDPKYSNNRIPWPACQIQMEINKCGCRQVFCMEQPHNSLYLREEIWDKSCGLCIRSPKWMIHQRMDKSWAAYK